MEQDVIVMKVSGGSDPKVVGSAIAHNIAEGKRVVLRAIGAPAINQCVKSVAISSQWTAPKGYMLACIPGFEEVDGRDGGVITAVTLRIAKMD